MGPPDLISVILPCYNREKVIGRAVESVLRQTYTSWELWIVDDCSTDNSFSIASAYGDPHIKILRTPKNSGAAAARNLGISHSKGLLISFLDSDDEYDPDFILESVKKFNDLPATVGLVWSGLRYCRMKKNVEVFEEYVWKPFNGDSPYDTFLNDLRIGTNSGITIRKEVFDSVGLFDDKLPASEDTDLFLRISRYYSFDFIDKILINIDQTRTDRLSKRFDKIAIAYNLIIPKHIEAIERRKHLRLKYFYKAMWLNYHLGDFTRSRYYFNRLIKDKIFYAKAWLIACIFEILGKVYGAKVHTLISSLNK